MEFLLRGWSSSPGSQGGEREFVPKIWERARTLLDLLLLMSQEEAGAAPGGSSKGNRPIPSLWNPPGTGWESPSRVWDPCRIQGRLFHLPRAPGNVPAVSLGSTTAHAPPSFLPSFLLPALYAEHNIIWSGISLWSVGVSCLSCVPSQLLGHPQSAPCWGSPRNREGPDTVQALLSNS